jgi:hypothetical protein
MGLPNQPARDVAAQRDSLGVQMWIAQQAIQRFQRRSDTLSAGPRPGDVHQRQPSSYNKRIDRPKQHIGTCRVHFIQASSKAFLQYCRCAHGVLPLGVVTVRTINASCAPYSNLNLLNPQADSRGNLRLRPLIPGTFLQIGP